MLKGIANIFKKGFRKVAKAFRWIGSTMSTQFKNLTWPKKFFKIAGIALALYLFVGIALTFVVIIATGALIGGVIFSFDGAIENGTNEVLGRNKRGRYY